MDRPKTDRSLGQAIVTALILVGLLVGSFIIGRTAFFVLVCFVVLMALFEYFEMLTHSGKKPVIAFGMAAGLAMLLVVFWRRSELLGAVLVAGAVGAFVLALRPGRGPTPASDVAWTVLGIAWIGGGGAGAVSILMLPGGRLLLVAFVVIVVLGDIGAYFIGVKRGKHKIAPSISPAKSWEGFSAGFASALVAGALAAGVLYKISLADGLLLGALCATVGPAGDLIESMVKREIGTKDSSRLLPGHGGFLDRLDAIVFTTFPAYLLLRFIVL